MLKRDKFSKLSIDEININITAHQLVIDFYEDYIKREGPYIYVDERLQDLYSKQAEYLIAREMHIEEKTQ